MTSTNVAPMKRKYANPQDEVDDELRHIKDLVFVRNLLAERGAAGPELLEYDAVIDSVRRKLANSAKRASRRFATAA